MGGTNESNYSNTVSYFTDGTVVPDLMTESELISFLRTPACFNVKAKKWAVRPDYETSSWNPRI